MKITKLEHACLDITDTDGRLIIDPGIYATSLSDFTGITAVVVTHVHADHLDESKILKITEQNPNVPIFCTEQVASKLSENFNITVPNIDAAYKAGSFTLEFFGGQHAIIMDNMPQDQNYGVLVNDALYYPGDSLTPCPKPHKVLALPAMAPWLKLSEAVAFMRQDDAKEVFPSHVQFMSKEGADLHNRLYSGSAEQSDKKYTALAPGESLEV